MRGGSGDVSATLPERISGRGVTLVSTVGLDEQMVRAYIRNQESEDERYEQMKMGV